MKKLLITTLLLMLLFPISAMSKGNDENAMSKREESKKIFLKQINLMLEQNKIIPLKGNSGKIRWRFKDEPAQLYLADIFLKYGDTSLVTETMEIVPMLMRRLNQKPIIYKDIYGNSHSFTRKQFVDQIRIIAKSEYPFVKQIASGTLIDLGYHDESIINDLIYFAKGTDIENWDIKYSYDWIGAVILPNNKSSNIDSLDIVYRKNIKSINRMRNTIQFKAIRYLKSIEDETHQKRIAILFNQIISNSNLEKRIKQSLESYLKKSSEKKKDGSFNLFEIKIDQKSINTYTDIWIGEESSNYCLEWYDDYNTDNYANYHEIGGDCVNFASQCLIAGNMDLTNAPDGYTDAYHCLYRTDSLHKYLTIHREDIKSLAIDFSLHPEWQADPHAQIPTWFRTGDIALLGITGVDNWHHTIINHAGNGTDARFGAHSASRIDKFLYFESWIHYVGGVSDFDYVTFYHVVGSTVLKVPSADSLTVLIGDTLNVKALVTNNTEPTSLNPITNFELLLKKKPENTVETLYETTSAPPASDSTYVFDFQTTNIDTGRYALIAKTTYTEGATLDSCILKVKAIPEIIAPLPNDIHFVTPPKKGVITDTLAIKVSVPQVLGSYPEINIKIDDVYVTQGDIVLEDSLWVYYWDLSGVSSDPAGKRHSVRAEILGDPKWADLSSIFTVEAVFDEDFETITDLTADGWVVHSYECCPPQTYTGWYLGNDPVLGAVNKCVKSLIPPNPATTFFYKLFTPAFTVPDSTDNKTKLEYQLFFSRVELSTNHGNIKFYVCNGTNPGDTLTTALKLYPIDGIWTDFEYDLSNFSGQTIYLMWWHYYKDSSGTLPCEVTTYALDDIVVYAIPDMDSPNIDFIYGTHAELNEAMILNLEFNDLSAIGDVTADYVIEEDSETIILIPAKDSYNYVGTIPARDHECAGSIVFKIIDSVGNETISDDYSMSWSTGAPILTAPENLLITMENDSIVTLSWDVVDGASEYKVYVSEDPYGTFTLDTLGTFISGTEWQKNTDPDKLFYYIVAANTSKIVIDEKDIEYGKLIWREEEILKIPKIKK
ncbi:MAG: amidase domain-containing protein [Candidatus Delongbacteria bacterium]|nr:amidase domain-containing protein [Candidatus Delongbacteria bacterium]